MNSNPCRRLLGIVRAVLDMIAAGRDRRATLSAGRQIAGKLAVGTATRIVQAAVLFSLTCAAFGKSPANDSLAKPQVITGVFGNTAGNNVNATFEPGEPKTTAGRTGGKSVWFRWVAPTSGSFTFSLAAAFDSQLGVYTGTSVGSLASIAESDQPGKGGDAVSIPILNGATYMVRVTGHSSKSGTFILSWSADPVYEKVSSFTESEDADGTFPGTVPSVGLVQGSDGNFYGTTSNGGAGDNGMVFKITPGGVLTTLVEFADDNDSNNGRWPRAGLVQGSDGNFYGTTSSGGGFGGGTVFKMTPAGVLTTLVEFNGFEGFSPEAGLVEGSDGNFYGTTASDGASGNGTVFKMTPGGVLTTLVNFTGTKGGNKGSYPSGKLLQDSDGNFYGTTLAGGAGDKGTVFKMTPGGVLTTLVEFTGTSGRAKGSWPFAGLVHASDGNFYGTTYQGGASDYGTVFKMTPGGVLTTLVEFTADSNNGWYPNAGLVQGSDGNLYGATRFGGASNKGTIFRIMPSGVLTTLFNFADDSVDSAAVSLVIASDGNLYGTTLGDSPLGDGSIYRIVFTGVPNVYLLPPEDLTTTSVVLQSKVNPRGFATLVSLEYGNDGVAFPNSIVIPSSLTGYQSILVGRKLGNLTPGATYYYRFRAASSLGESISPVQSVSTLAVLTVAVAPATDILPTSARFNGTVNARNIDTTAVFEWGGDGNSFPNRVPAIPGMVTGNTDVAVSAPVAGLIQGRTYYYRIVATNLDGTTVSGQQSFTTPPEPTAIIGNAYGLDTVSARVFGTVIANGWPCNVSFEYGTDGADFSTSVAATPASVTGDTAVEVSATLANLQQGTTYQYRVRAVSVGGETVSAAGTFHPAVLWGHAQMFPFVPLAAQGLVAVTLTPSGVGAWRFAGEHQWRASNQGVWCSKTSDRVIECMPVKGYIQPPPEPVSVFGGGAPTFVTLSYHATGQSGGGGLSVILKPDALALPDVPEAQRAQWRLFKPGINYDPWLNSGALLPGLVPGSYLVECKPVAGRSMPPPGIARVEDGSTSLVRMTYFPEEAQTGAPPAVLPFQTVATSTTMPYAYVGQIRSDTGSGSGFVVKPQVVATAGHVVFDDGTLSAVTGLQWLFQRDSAVYEPQPQIPRGFYLLDDYAAERKQPGVVPGEETPASQNRDAAALYFYGEDSGLGGYYAGRGGYSGFLASDATDNEFLGSSAQKILVGYPVDSMAGFIPGRMYATAAMNARFTRVPAVDQSGNPYRTYTTADIRGSGGISGGPLCVQFEGGNYFPAAIYLGGSGQTVVRSIDSSVIEIFNRAELSCPPPHVNPGITFSSYSFNYSPLGSSSTPGGIEVTIKPEAACNAGARWGLRPAVPDRLSTNEIYNLPAGNRIVQLTRVNGFQVPADVQVEIKSGQLLEITYTYAPISGSPAITNAVVAVARGHPLNYVIVASDSPQSYTLTPSLPPGLTFNAGNGLISGTPLQAGVFPVTVGNTNTGGADTMTLTIISINQDATAPLGQPVDFPIAGSGSGAGVTFTATGLPPGVVLDPGTGRLSGSPLQAGVFSSSVTVSKGGASASSTFTLTVTSTPLDAWRMANFGTYENTGSAADNADPDHDGITNLLECALALEPQTSDASGLPSAKLVAGYLEFTYRQSKAATDITFVPQSSTNLTNGTWSSNDLTEIARFDKGKYWQLTVRHNIPISGRTSRFMRLKVTK